MPDSFLPPGGGLAPFDERDLDAVLAGKTSDVPVALRPVADVLAALRAGPAPAELHGEANALAEFRALGLGQVERRARPARPPETLLLEAPPAGSLAGRPVRPGRQPARHRGHPGRRRAPQRSSDQPGLLLGAAAAAAVVLALVVAGNFAGPFKRITSTVAHSMAGRPSATHSAGDSVAPGVETASAAREPTTNPSASDPAAAAQSAGSQACRAYYKEYQHPGPSAWAAELSLWHQLTKLVRSEDPFQVLRYCAPYVRDLLPGGMPATGQDPLPAHARPGDQGNGHSGQQEDGPGGSKAGSSSGQIGSGQDNSHGGRSNAGLGR